MTLSSGLVCGHARPSFLFGQSNIYGGKNYSSYLEHPMGFIPGSIGYPSGGPPFGDPQRPYGRPSSSLWGVASDFSWGHSLCLPPKTSIGSTWGVSSWCYICGIISWWFKFSAAVFAPCGCPFFFQFGLDHVFPDSGSGGPPCGCSSDSSGSWHSSVGAFSSDAIGSSSPTSPSTSSGSLNRAP